MSRLQLRQFWGRFGNQCGQYATARSAAERLGATLETPDWIGRRIFGLTDPLITDRLPSLGKEELPIEPGVAMYGYFQNQQAFDIMRRDELRRWLTVVPELAEICPRPRPFYIAAHLRFGDYVKHCDRYAVVSRMCFEREIKSRGYDERDVVWLTEEGPQPGTERMPGGLGFLFDFMLIMQADVVFRSNSTFSQWAAILGNPSKVYSPVVGDKVGIRDDIEFIEGNHPMLASPKIHKNFHTTDMVLA